MAMTESVKAEMAKRRAERVPVWVLREVWEPFKAAARADDRSGSGAVHHLMKQFIQEHQAARERMLQ